MEGGGHVISSAFYRGYSYYERQAIAAWNRSVWREFMSRDTSRAVRSIRPGSMRKAYLQNRLILMRCKYPARIRSMGLIGAYQDRRRVARVRWISSRLRRSSGRR